MKQSSNKPISLTSNPDSWDWATEFCNTMDRLNYHIGTPEGVMSRSDVEGWMISWFANAMMAMVDYQAAKTQAAPVCDATVSPDAAADWQKVMEALKAGLACAENCHLNTTYHERVINEALAICERNLGNKEDGV